MAAKGLNKRGTAYLTKWTDYATLFTNNNAAVILRAAFLAAVGFFGTALTAARVLADRANVNLSGITGAKDTAKLAAATAWGILAGNIKAYAIFKGDVELEAQMAGSTEQYLMKVKDANFQSACTDLRTTALAIIVADPLVSADYFVTADITACTVKVSFYAGKLGDYKVALKDVNDAKKAFKAVAIVAVEKQLDIMYGLLGGTITTSFAAFAGAFNDLIKLHYMGTKKQGVDGKMVKASDGTPIILNGRGAFDDYPVGKRVKLLKTDSMGVFNVVSLRKGYWKITFSAPGYWDQVVYVTVLTKDIVHLVVKMVEKPI
jgi:hypothetical protein